MNLSRFFDTGIYSIINTDDEWATSMIDVSIGIPSQTARCDISQNSSTKADKANKCYI